MEKFKNLSKDAVDVTEGRILEKWKNEDILNKYAPGWEYIE